MNVGILATFWGNYGGNRYLDLLNLLKTVPGVKADYYQPFTDYTHVIVQASYAATPQGEMLINDRFTDVRRKFKIIVDFDDAVVSPQVVLYADALTANTHELAERVYRYASNKIIKTGIHIIQDGVHYKEALKKKEFKKFVWFGRNQDLSELSNIRTFLEDYSQECSLTVISDSPEEFGRYTSGFSIPLEFKSYERADFDREISSCDVALFPRSNSPDLIRRFCEVAVRGMPFVWSGNQSLHYIYRKCIEHKAEPEPIEKRMLLDALSPVGSPTDMYELLKLNLSEVRQFRYNVRQLVLDEHLVYPRVKDWLEVLYLS